MVLFLVAIFSISKTETKMKRASLLEEGVERKELNGANMEPLVITSSGIVQNISRYFVKITG